MNAKLLELILYVSDASMNDPDFGMTKLNKILFNADFTAYGTRGQSITGEQYQKLENGPAVRKLKPCVREAQEQGQLAIKVTQRGDYEQHRVVALREPDLTIFDGEEIAFVDDSINLMRGMTATRVSDLSHNFIGWQIAELHETIPFSTVFLSDVPPTQEERDMALDLNLDLAI